MKRTQKIYVGFLVDKVALGQFILSIFQFSLVSIIQLAFCVYLLVCHRCYIISVIDSLNK